MKRTDNLYTGEPNKRKEYLDGEITHAEYYGWLADEIGVPQLRRYIPVSLDEIREKLSADKNLNNIALHKWDAADFGVRALAVHAGFNVWSLAESVCVLKTLAVRLATAEVVANS